MTSQTSGNSGRRRALTSVVAGGALAAGLLTGLGSVPAWAEPTTAVTAPDDTAPAPAMTADQALNVIATEYDTGSGGGQVSNLIHQILKLRSVGYLPSNSNKQAIVAALDKRPNQAPLVKALESTLAFQHKQATRAQAAPQSPSTLGINQQPPGQQQSPANPDTGGIFIGPGGEQLQPGTVTVPLG